MLPVEGKLLERWGGVDVEFPSQSLGAAKNKKDMNNFWHVLRDNLLATYIKLPNIVTTLV